MPRLLRLVPAAACLALLLLSTAAAQVFSLKSERLNEQTQTEWISNATLLNATDDAAANDDPPAAPGALLCSRQNFQKLAACCNKPRESFFPEKALAKCSAGLKKDAAYLAGFVKDYALHKFQSLNKNLVNMKYFHAKNNLGPALCYVECIFRNEKLIYRSKAIHYDKVMDKFIAAVNTTEPLRMEEIINDCRLHVEDLPIATAKAPKARCLNRPLLLMQCLRRQFMLECPPDKVVNSDECKQLKANLKICEIV